VQKGNEDLIEFGYLDRQGGTILPGGEKKSARWTLKAPDALRVNTPEMVADALRVNSGEQASETSVHPYRYISSTDSIRPVTAVVLDQPELAPLAGDDSDPGYWTSLDAYAPAETATEALDLRGGLYDAPPVGGEQQQPAAEIAPAQPERQQVAAVSAEHTRTVQAPAPAVQAAPRKPKSPGLDYRALTQEALDAYPPRPGVSREAQVLDYVTRNHPDANPAAVRYWCERLRGSHKAERRRGKVRERVQGMSAKALARYSGNQAARIEECLYVDGGNRKAAFVWQERHEIAERELERRGVYREPPPEQLALLDQMRTLDEQAPAVGLTLHTKAVRVDMPPEPAPEQQQPRAASLIASLKARMTEAA
jgi:hypothetical protein